MLPSSQAQKQRNCERVGNTAGQVELEMSGPSADVNRDSDSAVAVEDVYPGDENAANDDNGDNIVSVESQVKLQPEDLTVLQVISASSEASTRDITESEESSRSTSEMEHEIPKAKAETESIKLNDQENVETTPESEAAVGELIARFTELKLESDAPVAVDSADRQSQKYSREFIVSIGDSPSLSNSERIDRLTEKLIELGLDRNTQKRGKPRAVLPVKQQTNIAQRSTSNNFQMEALQPTHKAENAWKPGKPTDKVTKVVREIRARLNKITPTTFAALGAKLWELQLHQNEEIRNAVIDIIHEKAVNEPLYCPLYGDLCMALAVDEMKKNKTQHFCDGIRKKAQLMFEGREENRNETLLSLAEEWMKEDDARKKNEIVEKMDELKAKRKRRSLRNIGFICELYRHGLITKPIVKWCLVQLVKADTEAKKGVDEASVECAIKMIASAGKTWERNGNAWKKKEEEKEGQSLGDFMEYLSERAKDGKYCSRIRFMIVDLQELRARNWIARKSVQSKPKTMEIEIKQEEMKNQAEIKNEIYSTFHKCRASVDLESQVYAREFVMSLRNLLEVSKHVQCVVTEDKLFELGLDLKSMPSCSPLNKKLYTPPAKQQKIIARGPINRHKEKEIVIERQKPLQPTHKADNPWKPGGKSVDEVTKIAKVVRGLLNKITPTTLAALTQKFLEYKVYQDETIRTAVLDLIFDKAVEDPLYCPIYSDLCMAQARDEKNKEATQHFRDGILKKVQLTFERKEEMENGIKALEEEMSKEDEESKKNLIVEKITALKAKDKRRIHGNIGFIGELYRHGLITTPIVKWCLDQLVKADTEAEKGVDEDAVECAIKMIASVGKTWERNGQGNAWKIKEEAKEGQSLSCFLEHLSERAKDGKYCSGIRFMIIDLGELKNNNWVPRKSVRSGPKTMAQLHKEIENEELKKQADRYEYEQEQRRKAARFGHGYGSFEPRSRILRRDPLNAPGKTLKECDNKPFSTKPWGRDN